jgi:hypothetical protein
MRTTLPSAFPRRWSFPTRKDTSFTDIQIALMINLGDSWFVFLLQPVLFNICIQCCRSGSGIQSFFDPLIEDPYPGFGMETNPDSGIGIRNEHRRTFFPRAQKQLFGFKILKFFDADANPDAVSGIFFIQSLGRN